MKKFLQKLLKKVLTYNNINAIIMTRDNDNDYRYW